MTQITTDDRGLYIIDVQLNKSAEICLTQIGHETLGRLPPYVLRIAFRLAEGVAGYVEASREARCWQKGQNTRRA
ncbi:MAG TPA: hypothetical protein H9778_01395, partial [Candidatus Parabacteroides intestinavium]|nr:hypothetical protein [Candidatus Parabacteroides intestinavium]